MNLNKTQIAGRLTRDPETRYTNSGLAIADISLAVSRFFRTDDGQTKEETDFLDVTAFGKTAEIVQKHLHKGSPIYVEGRLKLEQWEKDGQKRSKLKVIAEQMQFVGPRQQAPAAPKPEPSPATPAPATATRSVDIEPGDIPF
jgi:single-strand DNA-binding protein